MPYAIAAAAVAAGGAVYSANQSKKAAAQQGAASDSAIAAQNAQFATTREDNAPFLRTGTAANTRLAALLGISPGVMSKPREEAEWIADNYRNGVGVTPGLRKLSPEQGYEDYLNKFVPEMSPESAADLSGSPLLRKFTQADLEADPVYNSGLKFGADQGAAAINARATQAGNYDSGATLKALTRFGNDYGSTKANESYNRFTSDQNNIFNRLSGVSGTGQVATNQVATAGTNAANNISSDLIGAGNARAAGIVGGANAWGNAGANINSTLNNYQNNQLLQQLLAQNNSQQTPYFKYAGYDASGGNAYG
jgi:hypothetical protein